MNILALDTCTEHGSIALAREGRLLEVCPLPEGWRSTTLHIQIGRLLEKQGIPAVSLDGYGVTSGPGSFTGVRVGLTAVKGLAEIYGKSIAAISTLETIVASARQQLGSGHALFAPILDARRGQFFAALYGVKNGSLQPLMEETVGSLHSFLDRLKAKLDGPQSTPELVFCGTELSPIQEGIAQGEWRETKLLTVGKCLAESLAFLSMERLERGLGLDAAAA